MKNPWVKISRSPYLLKEDRKAIEKYNKHTKRLKEHAIRSELLPVPFTGDVLRAKIVLLQLNPGTDHPPGLDDCNFEYKAFPQLKKAESNNLRHRKTAFPFLYLDPNLRLTGGFRYWSSVWQNFLHSERDYQKISRRICCIEYMPYHSKHWRDVKKIDGGREYRNNLIRKAMKRGAVILVMKGYRLWTESISELNGYPHLYQLNSRKATISRGNLAKRAYKILERELA